MFIFLTAIKHPKTANSYATVEKLLDNTLHSIVGQTEQEFRVVVVCNQLPEVTVKDSRIHFHVVDFPPVSKENGKLNVEQKFTDKGSKYFSGLLYAKQFSPTYVYILDSDDWVNHKLIETVTHQPKYPVWYVNKGYIVNMENKEFKTRSGLVRYCGSTFVYDYDFLLEEANITADIDENSTQQQLIAGTSHFFVVELLSNHVINFNYFRDKGFKPKPIPLHSACWVQGTGENISNTKGGDAGLPIDVGFAKTFHLPSEFLNANKSTIPLRIRDFLSSLKSMYTWKKSQKLGKKIF
jgi:hypothetical protein